MDNAIAVGFMIPNTLMSNNPQEIRDFYSENNGNLIYKSFDAGGWVQKNESVTVLKTSRVFENHLINTKTLQSCPGIFQELIHKEYEIRATIIGGKVFSGAIYSQSEGETIDWRYDYKYGHTDIRSIELPEKIVEKCLALCKRLGLVFACIDLILTKTGDYVFLEVNQAGQFLWKEEADPAMRILDYFCQYLAGAGQQQYEEHKSLTMSQFMDSTYYRNFKERVDQKIYENELFTLE